MSTDPDEIKFRLGNKMLAEIDLLLARNAEERAKLLQANSRIAQLNAEDAVLNEERAALIARGNQGNGNGPPANPGNGNGNGGGN